MAPLLQQARAGARQLVPISGGILLTILCLTLKENFPFTHYPMYSDFSDQTYYVWLGDRDGNPIPVQTITSLRLGRIKKVYNTALQEVREEIRTETGSAPRKRDLTLAQREGPARETLEWIYASSTDEAHDKLRAAAPLQLFHVDIRIADGQVVESEPQPVGKLAAAEMMAPAK